MRTLSESAYVVLQKGYKLSAKHPFFPFVMFVCMPLQEHHYDPEANTGYLAWRLKTVQRNTRDGFRGHSRPNFQDSPTTQGESLLTGEQLLGEECREALSLMRHSTDKSVVKAKMRATFESRHKLLHDRDATASILDVFPRFLDTPGLVRMCREY